MNNIEKKLSRAKLVEITEEEKKKVWENLLHKRISGIQYNSRSLLLTKLNFKMIAALVSLFIILGGGGIAVASNSALPGDTLFPVDRAVERIQLKLAGSEKQEELKVRFAEERVKEINTVVKQKGGVPFVDDLSGLTLSEVEVKVFTNETLIKIEAGDTKYGFITTEKDRAKIITLIADKYSISEDAVSKIIKFEAEDRDSRPEDKTFLNRLNSVAFSDDEFEDISDSLTTLESSDQSAEIKEALKNLLILLGSDSKVKIEMKDGEIKIKMKGDDMEFEMESDSEDDSNEDSDDDDKIKNGKDEKEDDDEVFCRGEWRDKEDCPTTASGVVPSSTNPSVDTSDTQEDDTEVFCEGEWRDPEDCDDSDSNDDDSDDDNSSDDDDDSDDNDDESDDDNDSDDDNSGHGGGDDDSEDDD